MKKSLLIFSIIILTILSSCRSTKTSSESGQYDPTEASSLNDRFTDLTSQYDDWKDATLSMKVSLISPKSITVSGKAYMTRDKSLSLSLRFLGMEVIAVYITNDSVFAIDRMNKRYIAESIEQLAKICPITVNDIQDLLLGQAFLIEKGTMTKSMAKQVKLSALDTQLWVIEPKKAPDLFAYAFAANMANQITALAVEKDGNAIAGCEYSQHTSTKAGTVAQQADFTISKGSQPVQASIKWDFGSAKWDTGNERTWTTPNGYKRITLTQLIESLPLK